MTPIEDAAGRLYLLGYQRLMTMNAAPVTRAEDAASFAMVPLNGRARARRIIFIFSMMPLMASLWRRWAPPIRHRRLIRAAWRSLGASTLLSIYISVTSITLYKITAARSHAIRIRRLILPCTGRLPRPFSTFRLTGLRCRTSFLGV